MNCREAKEILATELGRYRRQQYSDLAGLLHEPQTMEVSSTSGKRYYLEFSAVWDDEPNANLRVMGAIDDGGLRAFMPLTEDFIMGPNGSVVGE